MTPPWIEVGDDVSPEERRWIHVISDDIIARLAEDKARKWPRLLAEEGVRVIGTVTMIAGLLWTIGEPHLERYVNAMIESHKLASLKDMTSAQHDIDQVRGLAEDGRMNINQLTLKLETLSAKMRDVADSTRETRGDIKLILQRLPQHFGSGNQSP